MKRKRTIKRLAPWLLLVAVPAALAEGLDSLVTESKAAFDLRYRFENVEQDDKMRTAEANTLRLESQALRGTTVNYAYVENVRREFGPDSGIFPAKLDSDSHLLNARFDSLPVGVLTVFGYLLELENAPQLSSNTFGAHYGGDYGIEDGQRLGWSLAYAVQQGPGRQVYDDASGGRRGSVSGTAPYGSRLDRPGRVARLRCGGDFRRLRDGAGRRGIAESRGALRDPAEVRRLIRERALHGYPRAVGPAQRRLLSPQSLRPDRTASRAARSA